MRRAATIFLATVLAACAAPPPSVRVAFTTTRGTFVVRAEIARTESDRARGLMGRRSLAPDRGMLFVWPDTGVREFWMKGTLIPLDLVTIAGGKVTAVARMVPCPSDPCPLTATPPTAEALELPAGVTAVSGIRAGAPVSIPGL